MATKPTQAPTTTRRRDAEPGVPLFTTIDDGGVRVGLHPRTLRRAIALGELRGYKFGKALRVKLADLDAWAESKAMPNARTVKPARTAGKLGASAGGGR